jgi:sigma-E factor negative regulatory protein RseA
MNKTQKTELHDPASREAVSAWLDGHVAGGDNEFAPQAVCANDLQAWAEYHFIGQAMRGQVGDVRVSQSEFLRRWTNLRDTRSASIQMGPSRHQSGQFELPVVAANDALWKRYAGLCVLALGVGLGWQFWPHPSAEDKQTTAKSLSMPATSTTNMQASVTQPAQETSKTLSQTAPAQVAPQGRLVVVSQQGNAVVRDPELDELLGRHKQLGGATALQAPAGFLRSATFSPETSR